MEHGFDSLMAETECYIGTSGWHHPQWRHTIFPPDLSLEERLARYARRLRCVELDASRCLPSIEQTTRWRASVPATFRFIVRAPRTLTHTARLRNPGDAMSALIDALAPLQDHLGAILFELPPGWPRMTDRLARFLAALPDGPRYVFEFAEPDWHHDDVYQLLTEHRAAVCFRDGDSTRAPQIATAPFIYARLQGPAGSPGGRYGAPMLRSWATRVSNWRRKGHDVFVSFANIERGFAIKDAWLLESYLRADSDSP